MIQRFLVNAKPASTHREFRPWETARLAIFVQSDRESSFAKLDEILRTNHWEMLGLEQADTLIESRVREFGGEVLDAYELAERTGCSIKVFPEHFGAGAGRAPFAPPRINELFVDEMIANAGGRRLTPEECGGVGEENADYLLEPYVIELKEMRQEPMDATEERQNKLAALFAPYFAEGSEVSLDPHVLNESESQTFWDLVGRPVQNAVKKAGKQIRATKERLGLPNWHGAIIFVNNGGYTLSGENVHRLAARYAAKDTSQVQEVFTIAQSFGTNGFDAIANFELFPKPDESDFADRLYSAFDRQRDRLMREWLVPSPNRPRDLMEPQIPIQFIALDRLFTWIPGLPPRSWLGETG